MTARASIKSGILVTSEETSEVLDTDLGKYERKEKSIKLQTETRYLKHARFDFYLQVTKSDF